VPRSTSYADAQAVENDWKLIGSFEDSTWILVEIEGGVTHAMNPACAALPPFWRCGSFPLAGVTAGPATPFTSGQVDLWDNGARAPLYYRPAGGDPDALTARALSFRDVAGSVSARRHIRVAGAIEPLANQPSEGTYLLSGGQTVRLRAIPPPLSISGPADLAPGETGTYTAAPLFGLQLANPHGAHHLPPGAYGWTFHPGDTAAVPRKRVDVAVPIWHCTNQPTCSVELPRSGRLAVFAYVEDQLVGAYSGVIRVGKNASLVLTCNGRTDSVKVERGSRMECSASAASPGATLTSTEWAFEDVQGNTIPGPSGDSVWGGVMVVGGKMRVSAAVNGTTTEKALTIAVQARDWTGKISYPPEPEAEFGAEPQLRYPPLQEGDILKDGTLGITRYPFPQPASGYGLGSGPNEGWYFLDQLPYFNPRGARIFLNRALMPDDPFYRAQRGSSGSMAFGIPACGPEFMRLAARHVPAHESGHYSLAKTLMESAEGVAMMESAVIFGEDPEADGVAYNRMFSRLIATDSARQAQWDRTNVLRVPCRFTVPRD
jgi:hypothetical protein